MEEWFTTGEMLDQLRVGEWAISEGVGYIKVTKTEKGSIVHDCGGNLVIGSGVSDRRWRIIPNYVTFEEAMQALNAGKYVTFHPNYFEAYSAQPEFHVDNLFKFTWEELIAGKWTIGD